MISITGDTKEWKQSNESDLFGNISVTKNITFDTKGYLQLSNSVRAAIDSTQDADLDETAVFVRSDLQGYLAVTHDKSFNVDASRVLGVLPVQSAGIEDGSISSDATYVGGLLAVTRDGAVDVDYFDPGPQTWTDTNISLTSGTGVQHPIEKFISLASAAIADVNTVKLYATPLTATPTLTITLSILSDFYITSLCYFNQNLYIGTMNRFSGNAFLYVWNGTTTAAQSAYEVDSNIIYDVCVHQDSVVCFTGKGQLLRFNGSGFTQLDALPSFYSDIVISDETNINMYHNCLKSNGDILYINVSTESNRLRLTNQPDGIWCYDSSLGFMYHRYGLSNSTVVIDSIDIADVNTTTNQITVTSAPFTGTEVIFNKLNATPPTPLIDGKKYYVIKIDSTHVQLATTKANATAGTPVDITAQASSATALVFFPNYDFGQYLAASRGVAILPINREIPSPQFGTDLLWGGTVSKTDNTSLDYIGTTTPAVETRGYLITPKMVSNNITDTFNLVTLKFSPFISENDKIIIKYRTVDDRRNEIEINASRWLATWTSTTTFTTTETEFATAIVGDEVEFLSGGGAGILAHITQISENAGTYTVTIDETYDWYTSGDKANFVFRNWKKWKTISYGDSSASQYFLSEQLGVTGKFLQLKVELRGVQIIIEDLLVDNVYRLPARGR